MARPVYPHIPFHGDGVRILGINPWIMDFAAFNLWSRPVGLLACLDMLRESGASVGLMDCLDPTWADEPWPKPKRYGTGHYPKTEVAPPQLLAFLDRRFSRYGLDRDRVVEALSRIDPAPECVLVSSIMTYWYPGALEVLDIAAELWPEARRVLGGSYATLCTEHAAAHADAHLILEGRLEDPANWEKLWACMDRPAPVLPERAGLSLALDLYEEPVYAPVLGSRGCPFTCEYCASRALYPGFRQGEPEAIFNAIKQEYDRGVRDFAFYDDALLIRPEQWLWPVTDMIGEHGLDLRLHTPNAMHVRHLSSEVCGRLKAAGLTTVRLGLETTDFDHRNDVKLTREQWETGARNLVDAGFDLNDIGVYILFGLPGQDLDGVGRAVDHVRSYGFRPHLAHYTPIPGSPMFGEAVAASEYPIDREPLFQNNSIWPCVPGGFDWETARQWKSRLHGK